MQKARLLLKLVVLGEREIAARGTLPHRRVFASLGAKRKAQASGREPTYGRRAD